MTLKELYEKRAKLVADARAIVKRADDEKRGITAEENAQVDAFLAESDTVKADIERCERLEERERVLNESARPDRQSGREDVSGKKTAGDEEYRAAFGSFLRNGMADVSPEHRSLLQARRNDSKEVRAFSAGTGNTGGYTVPQDFLRQLEVAMKAFGWFLDNSQVLRTDTGATLPMATFNYTGVVASIVGENAASSADASTPFGVKNLGAYTYRTPYLPISYEFLQDSAFGEQFIIDALAEALGRGISAHTTTGTGTSQPRGIVIDAALGKTGTAGQTTSVIYDDLVDLIHSVDPAYRVGAKFMMADSSLKVVRKLKDSQNRPLWEPSVQAGVPDSLLGYPVVTNQDVAVMAANAKSILFGRLDKYKTRIVKDVTILRLVERFAENLQVAFLLFMRADGALLDAGTNPVKYYANSAT